MKLRISRKAKWMLFLLVFAGSSIAVCLQYFGQKARHERLEASGLRAPLEVATFKAYGSQHVRYSFVTANGTKVEGNEKCGNCLEYYAAHAIYNPIDPNDYELSIHFAQYHPRWRLTFFFLIYLPIMTGVNYGICMFLIAFVQKIRTLIGKDVR